MSFAYAAASPTHPQRPRRWRRPLAGSAAVVTFAALGIVWGTAGTALATPFDDCSSLQTAFANGGTFTLADSMTVSCSLVLASGKSLELDLGSQTLTVIGPVGTPGATDDGTLGAGGTGGEGAPGIEVQAGATLYVTNGTLDATGGTGGTGGAGFHSHIGTAATAGGTGGSGGAGALNEGTLVLDGVTVTTTGGVGGQGGPGGDDNTGFTSGNGGNGGAGGVGVVNYGVFATDAGAPTGGAGNGGAGGNAGAALSEGPQGDAGDDGNAGDLTWGIEAWTTLNNNADDAADPTSFSVYALGSITDAAAELAAAPVSWPSRDGYTLAGWYTSATGGTEVDSDTGIGADGFETVYAHWTAVEDSSSSGDSSSTSTSTSTVTSVPTSTSPATTATTPSTSVPSTTSNTSKATTSTSVSTSTPSVAGLPGTDSADLGVNDHTPAQGGNIVLTAHGFKPGTNVDFWMHSTPVYLGSAIANAQGIATLPVTLDRSLVGLHHVQAIGVGPQGQPRNLAQAITIAAPPALASTGFPTWSVTLVALLLIAAGAGALAVQRRLRHPLDGTSHR